VNTKFPPIVKPLEGENVREVNKAYNSLIQESAHPAFFSSPVESTLQHRHIAELARCKVCLAANKDMMHALVKCSPAKYGVKLRKG
jgi:hypothetical protein